MIRKWIALSATVCCLFTANCLLAEQAGPAPAPAATVAAPAAPAAPAPTVAAPAAPGAAPVAPVAAPATPVVATSPTVPATSTADKQAIQDLMDAMQVRKNMDAYVTLMIAGAKKNFTQLFPQLINADKTLKPKQRDKAIAEFSKEVNHFMQRYEALFRQKIDYSSLIEEITAEAYGHQFTTDEIKDMTQFYRSPTGQKLIERQPQMAAESMKLGNERVLPLINAIMKQLIPEEINRLTRIAAGGKAK